MDSSQDDYYYTIVDFFPTGEDRFDKNNITEKRDYFSLCNLISPTDIYEGVEFINPCMNVATYIEDFYKKWSKGNESDRCKYLNYSINDIVKNDINHKYKKENFIQAYDRLATKLNVCKDSIKTIEDSVFKNVKDLLNIYYKFNKYINSINSNQPIDCQDLSNIVELYMNIKNTCNGGTNKFCDAVDKFKNYYHTNISLVKCKNVKYNLKPFLSLDNTETVTFEEERRAESGEKAGKSVSAAESVPLGTHVSRAAHKVNPGLTPGAEMFISAEEEGYKGESITVPSIEVPSESIMNKNVSIIGATFAGSSLFLVMMYKYTPLGSWVSTKILGRNNLMENMEKNYEFILNNVGNRETSLNDPMYNIRYNSATNH